MRHMKRQNTSFIPVRRTHVHNLTCLIIMDFCKAPALRFKALNKHSITHMMYIEMENVISNKEKKLTHNVDKGSSVTMHTHTHTHALYRLIGVKGNVA